MTRPRLAALCALALIPLVAVAPALAQGAVVDAGGIFGAWRPYLVELATILITIAVAWLGQLARERLGLDIEARHREALQTALTNAAGLAIAQIGVATAGARITAGHPAIAEAATYVLKGAPDALAYFGLGPDRLRQMVEAKIGVITAQSPPGA